MRILEFDFRGYGVLGKRLKGEFEGGEEYLIRESGRSGRV